jgi:putative colanic acid biosynthesis UDP-glucose lipid carrier transferase
MLNRESKSYPYIAVFLRLFDLAAILLAGEIAGWVAFNRPLQDAAQVHVITLYFSCAVALLAFPKADAYRSWRGRAIPALCAYMVVCWGSVVTISLIFVFLIHLIGSLSRLWVGLWFLLGIVFIISLKIALHSLVRMARSRGKNTKSVLLVGYESVGREVLEKAAMEDWRGYAVKAIYAGPDAAGLEVKGPDGPAEVLTSLENLHEFVKQRGIQEIWITLPLSASMELEKLRRMLENEMVDIRWIPDVLHMRILSTKMITFLGFPAFDLNRPSASNLDEAFKTIFDKVFAFSALLILTPVFAVIAIAIKSSSPGPIFFRQLRQGLNGTTFNVYKFRTMRIEAVTREVKQATANDPRVTRIGAFLRRTSLDELPQFINVLMGDMSVVGPRPHAVQHNELYRSQIERYMLRHKVKPGITGWAQMHGYRGETDTTEKMLRRVQLDIHYIQHWSLWMDIKIIGWTLFRGWSGPNAY